jgi:hypothetical protein
VSLSEFTITPDVIDAPVGTPIVFEVVNEGTAPHTFAVSTTGKVYETEQIQAGGSATLRVDASTRGPTRPTARSRVTRTSAWSGSSRSAARGPQAAGWRMRSR